ncbi:MAG: hypothetical protein IPP39_13010 [Chitinophagaceae bacterium]|nr:hypothetical protein [Chitinophagaceae bacterium]
MRSLTAISRPLTAVGTIAYTNGYNVIIAREQGIVRQENVLNLQYPTSRSIDGLIISEFLLKQRLKLPERIA